MEVAPYFSFDGTCVEAFDFYAETLGGEVEFRMTYGESPIAEHTPDSHKDRILHSSLRIGARLIMGADAPPQWFSKPQGFRSRSTIPTRPGWGRSSASSPRAAR